MTIKNIILMLTIFNISSSPLFSMDPADGLEQGKSNRRQSVDKGSKPKKDTSPRGVTSQTTPPQKTGNHLVHSAPAVQRSSKGKERADDSSTTPLKGKAATTEPVSRKPRSVQEVYSDQQVVSKRFFGLNKRMYVSKSAHIMFIDFIKDYTSQKPTTLDITGLSARSRIYLMSSIINFKISYLPSYGDKSYDEFKAWVFPSNGLWQKRKYTGKGIVDFSDLVPTTFKIGNFTYEFKQGPTFHQKGSGRIFGLISPDAAEKYEKLAEYWQELSEETLGQFSQLLLAQKSDGNPIDTGNEEEDRFFNGLNLLFDYEVARRLAEDDKFGEFPIISYISYLLTNLSDKTIFKNLTADKDQSLFQENTETRGNPDRIAHAKTLIPQLADKESKRKMRSSMEYLHQLDENSGDEYSGDEDSEDDTSSDIKLKSRGTKDLPFRKI